MSYNQKGIPAFGGVVSKGATRVASDPLLKTVYSKENLNLYTFNSEESDGYYALDQGSFTWFGGKRNSSGSTLVDIDHNDDKFVLLKFGNSELQLYTDHYSKIPLFYIKDEDRFIFSTSVQLLLLLNPEGRLNFSDTGILFYYNFV